MVFQKHTYEESNKEDTTYHSHLYHRHFDGYKEIIIKGKKGKDQIKRIYTADYFRCSLSLTRKIILRILYLFLYILSILLCLSSALSEDTINLTWYVTLPQAVLVPFFLWGGFTLLYYIFTFGDMTIGDYRTCSGGVKKVFLILFFLQCIWIVDSFVYVVSCSAPDSFYIVKILFSAACCFSIFIIETHLPYQRIGNPNCSHGVEIH